MAKKLKDKRDSKKLADTKFVEMQRMKREIGPQIWAAIKSDASAETAALNAEMGESLLFVEGSSSTELILRAHLHDGTRRLHVQFDPESAQIMWATEKGSRSSFELAVGPDGKPAFHSGNVPFSTGSIARQMLESLLD
jgi:hypothetical protein